VKAKVAKELGCSLARVEFRQSDRAKHLTILVIVLNGRCVNDRKSTAVGATIPLGTKAVIKK